MVEVILLTNSETFDVGCKWLSAASNAVSNTSRLFSCILVPFFVSVQIFFRSLRTTFLSVSSKSRTFRILIDVFKLEILNIPDQRFEPFLLSNFVFVVVPHLNFQFQYYRFLFVKQCDTCVQFGQIFVMS